MKHPFVPLFASFFFGSLLIASVPGCGAGNKPSTLPSNGTLSTPGDSPTSEDSHVRDEPDPGANGDPEQPDKQPEEVINLEPIRIEVVGRDRAGDPELEAFDARALLDQGNEAMAEERYDDAIVHYEKLLSVFPHSGLAPAAAYNIGLAYEGKDDYDTAIEQYRVLARDPTPTREAIDAHMRIAGILAHMQRWDDAAVTLREVLARTDLTHTDRIEGMARLGYVALEKKDYTSAESVLRESIAYYEKLTTGLDTNYFIAMSHYYLAQIPHRQFQALPMRLPDAQLQKDFQTKTELVKLAYDRYVNAVQMQNAYWATAAGYQLSQIYKEFWDDIVLAPVPEQLSSEAAEIYVQELHEQMRVLLEKAVEGHSKNIELAQAYRTATPWSQASRTQATEIAEILARESAGELVKPERATASHGSDVNSAVDVEVHEYIPERVEL